LATYLVAGEASHRVVELNEQHLDGHITEADLLVTEERAEAETLNLGINAHDDQGGYRLHHRETMMAYHAALAAHCTVPAYGFPDTVYGNTAEAMAFSVDAFDTLAWNASMTAEFAAQAAILRDLVGNPFPPVTINPAWLAWSRGTVPKMAQEIYDERKLPVGTLDNARLAVLADALEEEGCTDTAILAHCRQPGEHVRGCWVVDLLLGKE
jgi:hypothetical protein